jgi:hypothetical protein
MSPMARWGERFSPHAPQDFDRFIGTEAGRWNVIIEDAGTKAG